MAEISLKSTKQQILDAYNEALTRIEQMESTKDDPREQAKKIEVERKEKSAQSIINKNILNDDIITEYNDLISVIQSKKAELKELYDIEVKLNTYVSLVNAEKAIRAELKEKSDAQLAESGEAYEAQAKKWSDTIQQLKDDFEIKKNEFKKEEIEYSKALSISRAREEEEYEYNLKRSRKLENDKWEDEKNERESELAEREEEIEEIERIVRDREEKLDELEAKVNSIPKLIEEATAAGKKLGKEESDRSHVFETRAINQKNEYEQKSLNDRIERLLSEIESKDSTINSLQEKLDSAYAQMRELASETVKSTGGVKILNHENSSK